LECFKRCNCTCNGKPTKSYKDEDDNVILLYNEQNGAWLYVEEDEVGLYCKSQWKLNLSDIKIIGKSMEVVQKELNSKGLYKWGRRIVWHPTKITSLTKISGWLCNGIWLCRKSRIRERLSRIDEFEWKFK
jgi:hypothetical protein